jgi:hypothetical protein
VADISVTDPPLEAVIAEVYATREPPPVVAGTGP